MSCQDGGLVSNEILDVGITTRFKFCFQFVVDNNLGLFSSSEANREGEARKI